MTNREWLTSLLNSLSDEEVANYWFRLAVCEDCPMNDEYCGNCQTKVIKWLRAEHKEEEDE